MNALTAPNAGTATTTSARMDATDGIGIVRGRPLIWLRVEGLSIALAATAVLIATGQPWWLLPALFLVPDLAAIGYLVNRRIGALAYNATHTAPAPLAVLIAGWTTGAAILTAIGAIWLFHLGADRAMRYGVKYDDDPAHTHLGLHGRR